MVVLIVVLLCRFEPRLNEPPCLPASGPTPVLHHTDKILLVLDRTGKEGQKGSIEIWGNMGKSWTTVI